MPYFPLMASVQTASNLPALGSLAFRRRIQQKYQWGSTHLLWGWRGTKTISPTFASVAHSENGYLSETPRAE